MKSKTEIPQIQEQESESTMNLEAVPDKQLHEMERLAKELVEVMRKAKLRDEPLAEALHQLEIQAGNLRRARFDAANPDYRGY